MEQANPSPARQPRAAASNGAVLLGAPEQGTPQPLARLRRTLTLLTLMLVASLEVPYLVAAWQMAPSPGAGLWWVGLGVGVGLLVLAAALLAIQRMVMPELHGLARASADLERGHTTALLAAQETNEYLRDVSQEIRASMHAVLGLTQLLLRSPLDSNQHRQLRTIDGAARALLRIINDLLSLSGPGRGRYDFVSMGSSLHDLLRVSADLLEPAAKDKGLTLELRVALELPDRVLIDAGRVQQIVLGACRYAIEESEQGALRIDAGARNLGDRRFDFVLRVQGPVPRAVEPEPEPEPASLGPVGSAPPSAPGASEPANDAGPVAPAAPDASPVLNFARRLVGLMGGSLSAGTPPGMVEVIVPVPRIDGAMTADARARRAAAERDKVAIRLPATLLPILVVDADEVAQVAAVEMLENLGFEVEVAAGADRAVERVQKRKFALILMATDLPSPGGYAAAERIQGALGQQRPAIIGCTRELVAVARGRAGLNMEDMLAKPLERNALCAALAEWLPDETNPASSGTRLSQIGALEKATRRALAARLAPPNALPDLAPGPRSDRSIELFVLQAPGEVRSLSRAASRGRRDEVAELARRLLERCSNCGATKMVALCRTLESPRELSLEQLGANAKALGKALDTVLALLGEQPRSAEGSPASVTSDRNPDSL
jgi:two-component system, sensor histidine kinase